MFNHFHIFKKLCLFHIILQNNILKMISRSFYFVGKNFSKKQIYKKNILIFSQAITRIFLYFFKIINQNRMSGRVKNFFFYERSKPFLITTNKRQYFY